MVENDAVAEHQGLSVDYRYRRLHRTVT